MQTVIVLVFGDFLLLFSTPKLFIQHHHESSSGCRLLVKLTFSLHYAHVPWAILLALHQEKVLRLRLDKDQFWQSLSTYQSDQTIIQSP